MFAASLMLASLAAGQQPGSAAVPLWTVKAPHAVGDGPADTPSFAVYKPSKPNGTAVVVCPGGGYGALANDHEGKQVAEFFNAHGVAAFVLKYRIVQKDVRPGPLHPAPLLDAQRALRLVRANAKDYGIDPTRVGIMGFSAGGHLASSAGTHFDAGNPQATDPVEKQSCRPDFLILAYPVISMESGVTHNGSRNNLLGANPDPKLIEHYSNDKRVTKDTPPTFLFHTSEDAAVFPENAIRFYSACKKNNVPVELHMYEKGRHGVGINPKGVSAGTDTWKLRLAEWMTARGLLEKK